VPYTGLVNAAGAAIGQAFQQSVDNRLLNAQANASNQFGGQGMANLRPGAVYQTQGPASQAAMYSQDMGRYQERARHHESRRSGMTYMGQEWPRQPIPIRCDGWVSDTLTLQRHGYEFKVSKDESRLAYMIAIGKAGCSSMIMIDDFHYEDFMRSGRPLEFHGEFITKMDVQYVKTKKEFSNFVSVDMNDAYWCETEVQYQSRHIDVRELFPQSEKASEDSLIVLPDKQTVNEALEIILEKQAPRQEEIKRNRKRRDLVEKTQARIVTLEEIA